MNQTTKKSNLPVLKRATLPVSRHSESEDSPILLKVIKSAVPGLLIYLAVGLIATAVATAVAYANADPDSMVFSLSMLCAALASFAGGFFTSKKAGTSPLICGLIFTVMMTVSSLLLSLFFKNSLSGSDSFFQSLLMHLPAVASGIVGAFAGNIKKRPTKMGIAYNVKNIKK